MIRFAPTFKNPVLDELQDCSVRTVCAPLGALRAFGPSASSSSSTSNTKNYSAQTSVQGSSGTNSPTLAAGGNLTFNDLSPAVAEDAFTSITSVVNKALDNAASQSTSATQLQSAQQNTQQQQQDQNSQLLYDVLSNEQNLAAYQGSGGAIQQSQSTNYVIWGAIGIGAIAVLAFLISILRR